MSMKAPDIQRVDELIRHARRILLVTHIAPDGDAIGSLLGTAEMLRTQGKDVTAACADPVPITYTWLPGSEIVMQQGSGTYDLIVSLDCSDERRMGKVFEAEMAMVPLINIDHHVTNTLFGTVNWIDPSSVATAQMVLALAGALGWEVTTPVATCLLTGMVTDTRSFRTSNVDDAAMRAALRLIEAGASLSEITHRVLDQRPLASVRLWGQAIEHLHLQEGLLWTEVTRDMRQQWAPGENGDSGLANFLSGVREAQVVVVFTERDDGTVDVGMRAEPGYDVSQVALELGGGGHPQASGCTLMGELPSIRERVLEAVQHSLASQRQKKDLAPSRGQ
jgi:bifunctional oligoribonuclease and PAP phosphatase NrnA